VIPKIAHFYWGGGPFPFARLLSVQSFKRCHPGWNVVLWTAEQSQQRTTWDTHEQEVPYAGRDFFTELRALADRVEVCPVPGWLAEAHDVPKSDWARIKVLCDHGGFYVDTDVVFVREYIVPDYAKLVITRFPKYYQTAFIGSEPQAWMLKYLLSVCAFHYDASNYQSLGTPLWTKLFPSVRRRECVEPLKPVVIHPFAFDQTARIFESCCALPQKSVGMHWFAGDPLSRRWIDACTPETIRNYKNTFTRALLP
jgi:hypothetical protein